MLCECCMVMAYSSMSIDADTRLWGQGVRAGKAPFLLMWPSTTLGISRFPSKNAREVNAGYGIALARVLH